MPPKIETTLSPGTKIPVTAATLDGVRYEETDCLNLGVTLFINGVIIPKVDMELLVTPQVESIPPDDTTG